MPKKSWEARREGDKGMNWKCWFFHNWGPYSEPVRWTYSLSVQGRSCLRCKKFYSRVIDRWEVEDLELSEARNNLIKALDKAKKSME